MNVTGLDHVVLVVADVERSVGFYRDLLGVSVERLEEWRRGEVPFVSLRLTPTTIIDLFPGERGGTGIDHVALVVDDVDLDEMAQRTDLDIQGPPAVLWGARGNGRGLYLRDPDANLIELRTYAT